MGCHAKAIRMIAAGATWMGGAILSLVMLFTLGPYVEGKYFPVTQNVHADFIKVEGDKMLFHAYGEKMRDCSLIDARILVYQKGNPIPVKGVVWVVDDGVGPRTRALGEQDLGTWAVIPVGEKLKLEATYQCHPLWETRTELGTWEAK